MNWKHVFRNPKRLNVDADEILRLKREQTDHEVAAALAGKDEPVVKDEPEEMVEDEDAEDESDEDPGQLLGDA